MQNNLSEIAKTLRALILKSTSKAGSGHPTTCLSAVELMTVLFFGGFYHYNLEDPQDPKNHRVLFSKGHAAPLLYSLYAVAGVVTFDELMTLRESDSNLEGHPTPRFRFTETPTGSLGQGLSIGLGMALAHAPRVYVLLGDGEFAEGNIYEALELGGHYKAANLTGILDVNRLGQSDPTMLGWNLKTYYDRGLSFGWEPILVEDGHDMQKIKQAFHYATSISNKPQMIIAKTIKGKGISFLENKEGWHGKALNDEQFGQAMKELGSVDLKVRDSIISTQ